MEKLLKSMQQEQKRINDAFVNMPVERIDDVVALIIPPEECTIGKTRFFVYDDGKVELKRFIDRKLWCVSFTNGLGLDKVNSWLELPDEKFMKLAKLELIN